MRCEELGTEAHRVGISLCEREVRTWVPSGSLLRVRAFLWRMKRWREILTSASMLVYVIVAHAGAFVVCVFVRAHAFPIEHCI
jgi:hypothetical protein